MKGNGIGSIFSGLMRSALPMLKRGAMSAGKKLLSGGAGVLSDVMSGQNLAQSAKSRFKAAGRDTLGMQNLRCCKNLEEVEVKVKNETSPQP